MAGTYGHTAQVRIWQVGDGMAAEKTPVPPAGMGSVAKQLWKDVLTEFSLDAQPHKMSVLAECCRVKQVIADLDAQIAKPGFEYIVKGSGYNKVINPMLAEARSQRTLFAALVKALGLPESVSDTYRMEEGTLVAIPSKVLQQYEQYQAMIRDQRRPS